jgi:hypothetical protein
MAQCPICEQRVSLIYQVIPWNDITVFFTNMTKWRHHAIVSCKHCRGRLKVKDPFSPTVVLNVVATTAVLVFFFYRLNAFLGIEGKDQWLLHIVFPFLLTMMLVLRYFWHKYTHLEMYDEH